MTKKLGKVQAMFLRDLRRFGSWREGQGWLWDTPSGTLRLCEALERRGLVRRENTSRDRPTFYPIPQVRGTDSDK